MQKIMLMDGVDYKGIWRGYPLGIHLEPTKECNARCPQCIRTFFNTMDSMPNLNISEIDPEWLDNKFKNDLLFSKATTVTINGNHGDIVMHSNPKRLVEVLCDNNVKTLFINTNAGGLSTDFWKWLGSLNNFQLFSVEFAVDGLEDTHHLYRRNTRYETVVKNLQAFISTGGSATVVMNVNGNNSHQQEELKKRSAEWGADGFVTRYNHRFDTDYIVCYDTNYEEKYKLLSDVKFDKLPRKFNKKQFLKLKQMWRDQFKIKDYFNIVEKRATIKDPHKISCWVSDGDDSQNSFYLSADGRVWTCCWMELDYLKYIMHGLTSHMIEQYYYEMVDDPNFNSLHHYNGPDILQLDCFSKLRENWGTPNCLGACHHHCRKSGEWEVYRSNTAGR